MIPNLSEIDEVIKEIALLYADRRVNLFDVAIASLDGNHLFLSGVVLEGSMREVLLASIAIRFPQLRVDVWGIDVARKEQPKIMVVATNLTSMHASPSFYSEQVTQLMNGFLLEVLWEQQDWAFVCQDDGYLGWAYLPYLSATYHAPPTHLITAPVALLREQPLAVSTLVTRLLGGAEVAVANEIDGWAALELAGGLYGWLPQADLRMIDMLPDDVSSRRQQLSSDALRMIGVPYLWGGCTAHGIDCSGFAQLLYRWLGITLPRDADMQFAAGRPVNPPFQPGDLLFFGEKDGHGSITHVGVSLGGWRIIHSSRARNGVQIDDVQSDVGLREGYLCAATFIQ
jgi:gamma-D-glutamyl-L-lysine dipeptidyl-peptidase